MLAASRIVAGVLALRLRRLLVTTQSDRIADHLRWIVYPRRDDWLGHLEAALICACAGRKVVSQYDVDWIDQFEVALADHAIALNSYHSKDLRHNIEALIGGDKSGFPLPSDDLSLALKAIAPMIASCEKSTGGDGVEF